MTREKSPNNYSLYPGAVDELDVIFRQSNVQSYIKQTYGAAPRDPSIAPRTPYSRIAGMVAFAGAMTIGTLVAYEWYVNQLVNGLRHIPY